MAADPFQHRQALTRFSRQIACLIACSLLILCGGIVGHCVEPDIVLHNPNHLEPVSPFDSDEYDQIVYNLLVGPGITEFWMICKPSFSQEYALILRTEPLVPTDVPYHLQPKRWVLESATANEHIWRRVWESEVTAPTICSWIPESMNPRKVKIARKQVTIDEDLAKKLKEAWENVLCLTRYSDVTGAYDGMNDGVQYEFHYRWYTGQTSNPTVGIPAELVALGDRLYKLAKESPSDASAVMKECSELAKRLADDAQKELERTNFFKSEFKVRE